MSNVKNEMSNVNKVKLLSERTSGVPPVIFNARPENQYQKCKLTPSGLLIFLLYNLRS